jgi:hypothetical protein
MDIPDMLKRGLAVLLALLWLSLTGFNGLEDLNSPGWVKHHSSTNAFSLSGLLSDRAIDNDIDESAGQPVHQCGSFVRSPVPSLVNTPFYESVKIHKLNRVFLI